MASLAPSPTTLSKLGTLPRWLATGIGGLFFLFSDRVYDWFMGLPLVVTYSGAAIIGAGLFGLVYVMRRWPARFKPHRNGIKNIFGRLFDSLWAFLMVGLITKWAYPLTMYLLPYWQSPGFWIVLVLEALELTMVGLLRKPELLTGFMKWIFRGFFRLSLHVARRVIDGV